MWDRFWEALLEWFIKWVFPPFVAFLVLLCVVGLPVCIMGVAGCFGSGKPSVCPHQAHFGRCKVQVQEMIYNAATKTMMPSTRECGCVSDHGVVVIEKKAD